MKAITVRQPLADAIMSGRKKIENRGFRTNYRGWLIVQAGVRFEIVDGVSGRDLPRGALGVVKLLGVHHLGGCPVSRERCAQLGGLYVREWPWHWELGESYRLSAPIPMHGRLGVWEPSAEQIAAVLDRLPVDVELRIRGDERS